MRAASEEVEARKVEGGASDAAAAVAAVDAAAEAEEAAATEREAGDRLESLSSVPSELMGREDSTEAAINAAVASTPEAPRSSRLALSEGGAAGEGRQGE
eukprot:5762758-Prymnesium_polylepis.1